MENNPENPRIRNNDLLKIGMEIRRDISEKHEKIRERALTHVYQLVTAIGIIAGFGFTAISSVQSIVSFLFGESLLFAGMAVGMWFAKAGFIDEIKYLTEWANKLSAIHKERIDMEKKFAENKISGLQEKMKMVDNETGTVFSNKMKLPDFHWFTAIFILFISGCAFLLFSFVTICK
jgi:hypothetical protein